MVFNNLCVIALWMNVAWALEGLRFSIKIVLTYDTIDNNLEMKNDFKNYLEESCW